MHAVITFSTVPLFLGAFLGDWAYARSHEIQCVNFASWLITGSLLLTGLALLWGVVDVARLRAVRRRAVRRRSTVTGLLLMLATFVLGFINALVHARDGWAGGRQLWAVVNERDELGRDLLPDYLTSVREGAFYGRPYAYWGNNVDRRVQPQDERKAQASVRPAYALQSHSAPLGLSFAAPGAAGPFAEGAYIGMHGSWNRDQPISYKVIFVPFTNGRPSGPPVDFVTGFQADGKTMGRPVGVALDPKGALIVADDLSNTAWRLTRAR